MAGGAPAQRAKIKGFRTENAITRLSRIRKKKLFRRIYITGRCASFWMGPENWWQSQVRNPPRISGFQGSIFSWNNKTKIGDPKNDEKIKVHRMEFSIVESLSGLQESMFSLFRSPQLHSGEKPENCLIFLKFIDFSPFALFARVGSGPRAVLSRRSPFRIWLALHFGSKKQLWNYRH